MSFVTTKTITYKYNYSQIRYIATSREETKSAQNVAIIRIIDYAGFDDPWAFKPHSKVHYQYYLAEEPYPFARAANIISPYSNKTSFGP